MDTFRHITPATINRVVRGASVLLAAGILAACGSPDPGPAGKPVDSSRGKQVIIELVQFKPETLKVSTGDKVTWIQKDAGAHTVTSGHIKQDGGGVSPQPDGKFDSGEIETGKTFNFTFDEAGVYPYFCSLHPATMTGGVEVTGG